MQVSYPSSWDFLIVEPALRSTGAPQPEVPVARVVRWYKGDVKQNPIDYWSQVSNLRVGRPGKGWAK